jgi:hypothetical protein
MFIFLENIFSASNKRYDIFKFFLTYALLHESDISQLSLENFNQMIDITSEIFIVRSETT